MDKFHDVEFEEVDNKTKDKQISGTNHLYYNTSQVAQMLGIQDSKVRYYSKVFDDILKIEVINKQRKYKQEDIDKLRYMLELQAEGMSLKQIEQYCSEVSFEDDGKVQIKESNPLSIKALAQKLMDHQQEQIAAMEERIVTRLENYILNQENNNKEFIEKLKDEVSITVDEIVSEKLEEVKGEYNETTKSLNDIKEQLQEIKQMSCVTKEEIEKASYKEGFGRKLHKLLFGNI